MKVIILTGQIEGAAVARGGWLFAPSNPVSSTVMRSGNTPA